MGVSLMRQRRARCEILDDDQFHFKYNLN